MSSNIMQFSEDDDNEGINPERGVEEEKYNLNSDEDIASNLAAKGVNSTKKRKQQQQSIGQGLFGLHGM